MPTGIRSPEFSFLSPSPPFRILQLVLLRVFSLARVCADQYGTPTPA